MYKKNIRAVVSGENLYFSYSYPLPQLASIPKSYVLIMIPVKEVDPLLNTLLNDRNGATAVSDADENIIYCTENLDKKLNLDTYVKTAKKRKTGSPRPQKSMCFKRLKPRQKVGHMFQ